MSTAQCVNMLLDPELQRNVVCEHVPFGVNCNSSFIIDMNCLSNPKDILCDDMGTWKWKGSYRSWLSVDEYGFVTALGRIFMIVHLLCITESGRGITATSQVLM